MRLSIRVKLFLMINSLVLVLVVSLWSFTSFFIDDIFIDKYENQQIELFLSFQEDYNSSHMSMDYIQEKGGKLGGFISTFNNQMKVLETTTPGKRPGSPIQHQFNDVALEVINNEDVTYRTFVLDALHGEGNTMLLIGRLGENEYILIDKPLNFIVEVVDIINNAMFTVLIILLIIGFLMSYLASFIFTRPILKIRESVKAIAEKDFSQKLDIKNNDELGDLGHLINEISVQISDNFDEIEVQNEMLDKDKHLLENMNQQLQELSETDPLTKLNNRLKIDRVLDYELKKNEVSGATFSVIILDIDWFKLVNDNYGHLAGDKVIVEISNILLEDSRRLDVVGRWGGEEFIIVMPDTVLGDAINKAEKFRESIELYDFGEVGIKTASFGVGEYKGKLTLNNFIKSIDDALYRAKDNGRNRVEISNDEV